jgi:hypothetical protein
MVSLNGEAGKMWKEVVMTFIPCGGGLEYLHCSPESHRRRWEGNPVPAGIMATLSLGA